MPDKKYKGRINILISWAASGYLTPMTDVMKAKPNEKINNIIITSNIKRGAWGNVSKSKNQAPIQVKNTITKRIINSSKKALTTIASNGFTWRYANKPKFAVILLIPPVTIFWNMKK